MFNKIKEKHIILFNVLSSSLGILLTGLSFFVAMYFSGNEITDPVFIAFSSLIGGFLVDRIISTNRRMNDNKEVMDSYEKIIKSVSNSFSVEKISGKKRIDEIIQGKISQAITVRNTFLGTKSSIYAESHSGKSVVEFYKNFFDGNGMKWIDIVGVPELYGGRFEKLKKPKREDSSHYIIVSKNVAPIINFIIIQYDDLEANSDVFFGWQYSELASDYTVFKSSDPKIIELFSEYFNVLKSDYLDRFKIDYEQEDESNRIKKFSSIIDRRGCWITIGHENKEVKSIACFDIDFDKGLATITGRVVWKNKKLGDIEGLGFEDFHHKDESVSYTDQKIFLEYKNQSGTRRGICIYKFNKINSMERITGYLQDDDNNSRVQIIGMKVGPIISANEYGVYLKEIAKNISNFKIIAESESLKIKWEEFGIKSDENFQTQSPKLSGPKASGKSSESL